MLTLMDYLTLIMSVFAGSSVILMTGLSLYFKIRRKYPITVNCWFCNSNSKVPYESRNSWECPSCDQYNGFSSDGDYNKFIPEQHDEDLNKPVIHTQEKNPPKKPNVGLCWKCNCNQELKIYQLASFTPINPARFDEEVESFRKRLEKEYKLCNLCEGVLARTLQKQKDHLGLNFETLRKIRSSVQNNLKPKVKYGYWWINKFLPGIIRHLLVLFAGWMSLAHGIKSSFGNSPLISHNLSFLPPSLLPYLPWTLNNELLLIGAALCVHVIAALLSRHGHSITRGSITSNAIDTVCFLLWLSLQMLSWLSEQETYDWVVKHLGAKWIESFNFNYYMEICSCLILISQVTVALVPRPVCVNKRKLKRNYSFKRLKVKKMPVSSGCEEFSDGEEKVIGKDVPQVKNVQQNGKDSQDLAEAVKNPCAPLSTPSDEDVMGIGNLSLGPISATQKVSARLNPSPKHIPRVKPVIQPARLNLKNIVQSSWVAGGYWQVPNSNQFSAPLQGYHINPPNYTGVYYQGSPLSRSSSQSSGFVSHAGTGSNALLHNSNSLPGSASSSTCGDQESNSVFSEPAYHKFPGASYFGNVFSGNHGPTFSSTQGQAMYGMLSAPVPIFPHYPSYYRREGLLNVNHCCCCQSPSPKAVHNINVKPTLEDSDCHSSSSSGFSESFSRVKSAKRSQNPAYKSSSCKTKDNKGVIRQPGAAIWAVMQENVFLLFLLGSSLMFNAMMLYLMAMGKEISSFVS